MSANGGRTRLDLRADHHAHSLFSVGAGSVDETVRAAERAGLARLVIVDRVSADTDWLPVHRAVVRRAADRTALAVSRGLESAIQDTAGRLDLPAAADLAGVDSLAVIADGLPLRAGPANPADLRLLLGTGVLTAVQAVELLVKASVLALRRAAEWAQPVLARPLGLVADGGVDLQTDDLLTDDLLGRLAAGCLAAGATVEVNERWRCPSPRVAAVLAAAGVPLVAGSSARHPDAVGRWDYVRQVAEALAGRSG